MPLPSQVPNPPPPEKAPPKDVRVLLGNGDREDDEPPGD